MTAQNDSIEQKREQKLENEMKLESIQEQQIDIAIQNAKTNGKQYCSVPFIICSAFVKDLEDNGYYLDFERSYTLPPSAEKTHIAFRDD